MSGQAKGTRLLHKYGLRDVQVGGGFSLDGAWAVGDRVLIEETEVDGGSTGRLAVVRITKAEPYRHWTWAHAELERIEEVPPPAGGKKMRAMSLEAMNRPGDAEMARRLWVGAALQEIERLEEGQAAAPLTSAGEWGCVIEIAGCFAQGHADDRAAPWIERANALLEDLPTAFIEATYGDKKRQNRSRLKLYRADSAPTGYLYAIEPGPDGAHWISGEKRRLGVCIEDLCTELAGEHWIRCERHR